ncbi:unnamed protein product [Owenia fusiformis]|uniref:Uncharacterized protein n=1 Tax=Owenia fusiformis TaxID=6347 RepID=A0A8S4PKX9_OWEFU|nr:unnamed protein product [Owenia fusiformis]
MAKNIRLQKIWSQRKVAAVILLLGILSIMLPNLWTVWKEPRAFYKISRFEDNNKEVEQDIALVCVACNLQNGNTSETIPFFKISSIRFVELHHRGTIIQYSSQNKGELKMKSL